MLVSDRARLDLLLKAETEVRAHHSAVPPSSFYRDKLSSLWRRAAHAPAYADLGAFSPEAFDAVPVITKDELKASPWHFAVGGVDDAAKYYETTGTSGRVTPTPRRVEDVIGTSRRSPTRGAPCCAPTTGRWSCCPPTWSRWAT